MSSTPEELKAAMAAVDWSNTTDVKCSKCDNATFEQIFEIKRLSPLVSPTGQELMLPMNAFACCKCGHVNEELRMPIPEQ